jgi:uncharacterized protein
MGTQNTIANTIAHHEPRPLIQRELQSEILRAAREMPAVGITGPRQSGKTTLARMTFPDKPYVTLEDLDIRRFAEEDPRGFLNQFPDGAILDEIQRVPDLFSYLQSNLDNSRQTGRFILTGSQQFGLMQGVTQSLAGRIALTTLLPLSLSELKRSSRIEQNLNQWLFRGGYPRLYDQAERIHAWHRDYTSTYVERDVRQLVNVRDLRDFFRFIQLCAGRSGQLLNASSLAKDVGVNHETIRTWISVLEASYIIHLLYPHHRNFNKRIIKAPKLYFVDTGLMCYLLGIDSGEQIQTHHLRGAIFETFVVSEMLKNRLNSGSRNNLYFWRDRAGHEVDVIIEEGQKLVPVEIKSGRTIASDYTRSLDWWRGVAGEEAGPARLIYGGDKTLKIKDVQYVSWWELPWYAG